MKNTYKMLNSISDKTLLNRYNYKELISLYKNTKSSVIFATIFTENYSLFLCIRNRFLIFSTDDYISIALTSLDKAINTYDDVRNTKFTSYLYSVVFNECRSYMESLLTQKRKINYLNDNISLDDKSNVGNLSRNDFYCNSIMKIALNQSNYLNKSEKLVCNLIIENNKILSAKDIANIIGITPVWVYKIKKSLRLKLKQLNLIAQ